MSCARLLSTLLPALSLCATLACAGPAAESPCCTVVAIDKASGTLTLRDNKTGRTEKVIVKDAAKLAALTVGQPADRSLAQRYCSVETFEPCVDQERSHNCQPCPSGH
jgi:hypothetical protein